MHRSPNNSLGKIMITLFFFEKG